MISVDTAAEARNVAHTPNGAQDAKAHSGHLNGHSTAASGYVDLSTPSFERGELSPADREILETKSSISGAAIEARGYWTESDPAQLKRLGFAPRQCKLTPALVIPLHNYRGTIEGYAIRPHIPRDNGRGKPIKYESAKDTRPVIDVAPLTCDQIGDVSKPIIFTEGAKKADSAASRGLCAINFAGVSNFTIDGAPHPDLNEIPLKGRVAYIGYDSDIDTKPAVEAAARRLAGALQKRRAVVKIVYLPAGPNGEKTGLDDFFERGGTVEQLFLYARDLEPIEARRTRQIAATSNLPDSHAATFPDLPAEKIPSPKLTNEHTGRREYDARQIVELLRPEWGVAALTTHAAHAARIGAHIGGDVVFCPSLGWVYWNGRHHETDDRTNTATSARVMVLSRVVRSEAAKLYNHSATLAAANRVTDASALSAAAGELLKHARQVEGKSFIDGALHLAAGVLRCSHSTFDQKPWRIGFQNGTWDKGEWREHRRDDRALHLSKVSIDLDSERGEWLAVLDRITGGDSDYQRTLQDVAGYALSGASHLRILPWCYGPGGTGKSSFTELLQTVLGDMAATIDPEKLGANSARERLGAQLWNKRVAVCSEAGSQRLEAELLKTLSGSDSLDVRFLFREAFTAPPCHVLMMVANDPPRVDAYDAALKDRVIALPFVHRLDSGDPLKLTGGARIEAVRRDPTSPLVRGFAAWALEGLARLHTSQEIHLAACVKKATSRFWAETDPLTPFWERQSEAELVEGVTKTELRRRYEDWCSKEGARPVSARQWTRACRAFGLQDERRGGGVWWWFLPLVTEVTKQTLFPKSSTHTRETNIEEIQNTPCFVTSVTKTAGVPFMVTQQMPADLLSRGLSDADVDQLTPQQAHEVLAAEPDSATVPASEVRDV
jgi:P4 family phage/plasmid primase-like protien